MENKPQLKVLNFITIDEELQQEINEILFEFWKIELKNHYETGEGIMKKPLFYAAMCFGGFYLHGKKNHIKAFKCFYVGWYRDKCTYCGHWLADCYFDGTGVSKSITTSLMLHKKLARKYGHPGSIEKIDGIRNKTIYCYINFTKKQWKIINS